MQKDVIRNLDMILWNFEKNTLKKYARRFYERTGVFI